MEMTQLLYKVTLIMTQNVLYIIIDIQVTLFGGWQGYWRIWRSGGLMGGGGGGGSHDHSHSKKFTYMYQFVFCYFHPCLQTPGQYGSQKKLCHPSQTNAIYLGKKAFPRESEERGTLV